jgi:uncharacterized Zn finger protein
MGWYSYDDWRPYVSMGEQRRRARKKLARMTKSGHALSPIRVASRKLTATFWGDAWCKNLESYSDFSNRLPRGRTYLRNGSVIHLQIEAGRVRSFVSGSDLYELDIEIETLAKKRWTAVKGRCAGQIGSLVELLRGSVSTRVMEIVTSKGEGLFPSPREISMSCSCPDWATMCKHVAATLYGVGARLDREPELLFTLRGVDPAEMVEAAVDRKPTDGTVRKGRVLASSDLSSVFGVDIDMGWHPGKDRAAPSRRGGRSVSAKKKSDQRSRAVKRPAPRNASLKEKKRT